MPTIGLDLKSSAEPLATGCTECDLLISACELAKRNYAAAVDILFATGYRFKDKHYATLKNSVEETRAQREIAQAQLERHKRFSH